MRFDGAVFTVECACGAAEQFTLPAGVYRGDGPPLSLGHCHACGREYIISISIARSVPDLHDDPDRWGPWA